MRVARDVECSVIDALDAPVRADDREHARHGVRDGVEELDLGAQLRLEPVASKRQAGGRRHCVEQLRLVVERCVVRDRGDPPAIVLDELHRSARGGHRLRRGMPLKVDPATSRRPLTLVEPVDDGEILVLQGARERVSERRSVLQRNDQSGMETRLKRGAQRSCRRRARPWGRSRTRRRRRRARRSR